MRNKFPHEPPNDSHPNVGSPRPLKKKASKAMAKTRKSHLHSSSEDHMPESSSSSDLIALPSAPFFFFFGGCRALPVFGFGFAPVSGSAWFAFFAAGVAGGSSPFFPPSFFFFFAAGVAGASSPVMAVTNAGL
jgi:hypothetical protein